MEKKENKKVALNDELLDKIAGGEEQYEKHFCRICGGERLFVSYGGARFICTVCGFPKGS